MSTIVVSAAKAADRSDQSDIVCAHNSLPRRRAAEAGRVRYNAISFAVFAAYAGYTVDGGNGN